MMVLQVEGVYYDIHTEDGRCWLVRFEDGKAVAAVAEFITPEDGPQLEQYLSMVAEIVEKLEAQGEDDLTIH